MIETLKRRISLIGMVLLTFGVAVNFGPRPKQVERTTAEIENMVPLKLSGFRTELAAGQTVSYTMDKEVYEVLHPWAIVARVFSTKDHQYDVVVIASRNKDSFHDPQVCFKAQNWTLSNQRLSTVSTQKRGEVPVTLVDMEQDGERRIALYFFKTTQGYFGDIHEVKLKMMSYKFLHLGKDDEGAFIRIIPDSGVSEEQLKQFVGSWIDAASETSKGYY